MRGLVGVLVLLLLCVPAIAQEPGDVKATVAEAIVAQEITAEEIAEQVKRSLAAMPAAVQWRLPPNFAEDFCEELVKTGIPKIRKVAATAYCDRLTLEELQTLQQFMTDHPELVVKVRGIAKDVAIASQKIGQEIGADIATRPPKPAPAATTSMPPTLNQQLVMTLRQ